MNILALTCSSHVGSATITKGDHQKTLSWESERSHAEIVAFKLQELFDLTGLSPEEIDIYGLDIGPGSFTGIRIGCNTIKSFCYITKKSAQVFDSFEIIASGVPLSENKVCVTIDAFADSVYFAIFENKSNFWQYSVHPLVVSIDQLDSYINEPLLHVGGGLEKYKSQIENKVKSKIIQKSDYQNSPSSEIISKIISENKLKKPLIDWKQISPYYIKMSAAEEKLLV